MGKNDKKYKKPVVIEAVFELRFKPLPSWEIGSFVKFAELAKENGFPTLRDSPQQFQVTFAPNHEPIINQGASHIQTWNKEETKLWQVGQILYAANQREPYDGWEDFRPHILKGLKLFKQVAKPKEAEILAMRYINRINITKSEKPDSLITFLPSGIEFSQNISDYGCKAEYKFENDEKIVITSAKDSSQKDKNALILEILYIKPKPSLEINSLSEAVKTIHDRIVERFEKSITDKLRKRMEDV